MLKANFINGF